MDSLRREKCNKIIMKRIVACIITFSLFVMTLFVLFSCQEKESTSTGGNGTEHTENGGNTIVDTSVTLGTETYRGFILDNVYHSENDGDIHFNLYVPESYDGSKPYALYISLCGYGGYYFQGVGVNLRQENFVFEAQKYNAEMIIVAPQLNDWGITSANQTIALTEYFLSAYNIDENKVFMNGYSGGGETLSLVMAKKPELYTAVLHIASVWDGSIDPIVQAKIPLYIVIGATDEYYGSARISATYREMIALYERQGLTREQISEILVLDVKNTDYFNGGNQHGGIGKVAFDSEIMGWLFTVRRIANNITTRYDYDENTDRTKISYISGIISVNYNYVNGVLDNIVRGGYIDGNSIKQNQTYKFNYDGFGNVTSVSVGNYTLVSYTYAAKNGHLTKTTYGNGTYIENTYDELDRIVEVKINGVVKYKYSYNGNLIIYKVERMCSFTCDFAYE